MKPNVDIQETSILSDDAQLLISILDRELSGEYAPEHRYAVDFESFNRKRGLFVIAYEADVPVACGALRPISKTDFELKRMFVVESHRGRGISRQILTFLENRARLLGCSNLMLETGDEQKAAIQLYRSSGYHEIPAFGEYVNSERSVCFAKKFVD